MAFLDEKRCAKCGKSEEYVDLDKHHIITKSKGGVETVYLCRVCHRWVGNHIKEAKELGLYISDYIVDKKPKM